MSNALFTNIYILSQEYTVKEESFHLNYSFTHKLVLWSLLSAKFTLTLFLTCHGLFQWAAIHSPGPRSTLVLSPKVPSDVRAGSVAVLGCQ